MPNNNSRSVRHSHSDILENRSRLLTQDSPFAIKEAYVQLRTNLLLSVAAKDSVDDSEQESRVFAFTSPSPSEGKSLTASNTAISFAMLGERTLLIDCDMRKPSIHKLWGADGKSGMSNLLTGVGESAMNDVEDLPLTIITAGSIPPNPSELLSSQRFQNVVEVLKSQYRYIVIDTPPVGEVADAQIIAKYADGMVLIVRSGETSQNSLADAEERIARTGGKLCGIVVNDVNSKGGRYSYKYKYKYGYRHGYRYGYKSRNYEEN